MGGGGVRGHFAAVHSGGLDAEGGCDAGGDGGVPVRRDPRGGRGGDRGGAGHGGACQEGGHARQLHHRGDECVKV